MTKKSKRILAIVLAAVILASAVAGVLIINNNRKGKSVRKDRNSVYYELKFALANDTPEDEAGKITLPKTAMVPAGTPVSSLTTPSKDGSVFTGWYYDGDLTLKAGYNDKIEKNMTLYPKFSEAEGFNPEFGLYYVASRDVGEDYILTLAANELTAEEVRSLLAMKDSSDSKNIPSFVIEPANIIDLDTLIEDAEVRESVKAMLDDGAGEYALSSLGLDDNTVRLILWAFNPEEAEKARPSMKNWLISNFGDDEEDDYEELPEFTEEGFREFFGIEDSMSTGEWLSMSMGYSEEQIAALLEELNRSDEFIPAYYILRPSVRWTAGDTYSLEISDTSALRFVYNGEMTEEAVVYYNFTVDRQEIQNMRLNSSVIFVPLKDARGMEIATGLYMLDADTDGNIVATENKLSGNFTYEGTEALKSGDILAVYDGTLRENGTVDGLVQYIKITGVEGSKCTYENATVQEIVFLPDNIPVPDDGSFGDGKIFIDASLTDTFSDKTYVEPGDFITFYNGRLGTDSFETVGYGCITDVIQKATGFDVSYNPVTLDEMLVSANTYVKQTNISLSLTEDDYAQMKTDLEAQACSSGFFEDAEDYIKYLTIGSDFDINNSQYKDELLEMSFLTDTGESISLGDVRLLSSGMKAEVSKPVISVNFSPVLQHFDGVGLRLELAASFTVTIHIETKGQKNKMEIKCVAAFEQEVTLGIGISSDVEWIKDGVYIPKEIVIKLALQAGTYTGLGAMCTVTTSEDKEEGGSWNDLISNQNNNSANADKAVKDLRTLGTNIEKLGNTAKAVTEKVGVVKEKGEKSKGADDGFQSEGIGGDLTEKYSNFLDNDSEYVSILEYEFLDQDFRPDPLGLTVINIKGKVFLKIKVNAMLGFGISYGNCKQISCTIRVFGREAESSNDDLETPNFRADFYIFGMIGVRAGVGFEINVGLISTDMDSLGVSAEAGLYAEVYGFLYMHYSWEAGKGESKGVMGSLLFEIGVFLDMNFTAQLGNGKLAAEVPILELTWPLLQLGAESVPVGYADDDVLEIEIKDGATKAEIPGEFFLINLMDMKSGDVSERREDYSRKGSLAKSWWEGGVEYFQYNEISFNVEVSNRSFVYDPVFNRITVYPKSSDGGSVEADITFTYINHSFGFNTESYTKTVHVKWIGDPQKATFQYYRINDDGTSTFIEEESFDGFDGIEYSIEANDGLFYKYDGIRLMDMEFPKKEEILARIDFLKKEISEMEKAGLSKRLARITKLRKAELERLQTACDNYEANIRDVASWNMGTFTFPMASDNTVVKFFYGRPEIEVYYIISNGALKKSKTLFGDYKYTVVKSRLYASGEVKCRYMDAYSDITKAISELGGYDVEWVKVDFSLPVFKYTAFTLIKLGSSFNYTAPGADEKVTSLETVYLIGIAKASFFNISWKDGDTVLGTDSVQYNASVRFPAAPEKQGYTFEYWTVDGKRIDEGYTMPANDVEASAVFKANVHTVTWVANGKTVKTEEVSYGESLVPPDGDVCSTVSWVFEGNEIISVKPENGGTSWTVTGGMYMPDDDITLTSTYSELGHEWDEQVTREATASKAGEKTYTCKHCGATRTEEIKIKAVIHSQQIVYYTLLDWGYESLAEWCGDNLNEDMTGNEFCFNIFDPDYWNGYLIRAFVGNEEVTGTFTLDRSEERNIREMSGDNIEVKVHFTPDSKFAGTEECDYVICLFGENHKWSLDVCDVGYQKGLQILNQDIYIRGDVPAGTLIRYSDIMDAFNSIEEFKVNHTNEMLVGFRNKYDESDEKLYNGDFEMPDNSLYLIAVWVS